MTESPHWPHRIGYFKLLGLAFSIVFLVFLVRQWERRVSIVEREDLLAYIHATVGEIPLWHTYILATAGTRLAVPSDVGPLGLIKAKYDRQELRNWLRESVYGGRTVWGVLRYPLIGFGVAFIVLVRFGAILDKRINREAREGHLIRGPRVISRWRWNLPTLFKNRGFYIDTR